MSRPLQWSKDDDDDDDDDVISRLTNCQRSTIHKTIKDYPHQKSEKSENLIIFNKFQQSWFDIY